jgi:hypothetical protein
MTALPGGQGMTHRNLLFRGVAVLCFSVTASFAGSISLQEMGINVNGLVTDTGAGGNPFTVSGVNASGFNQDTGLGTLTFTFDPGKTGSYYVDFFLDPELSVPFYNEYGAVNGSLPSDISYQIDDPYLGSIYGNFSANTLDDTNHMPGQADNYLGGCSGADCNGDVSLALGFNFTLQAGYEAVITLDATTTNPGGFSLQQVHPIDPNNATATDYYLAENISIQPVVVGSVPEPGSLLLAGSAVALLAFILIRRRVVRG